MTEDGGRRSEVGGRRADDGGQTREEVRDRKSEWVGAVWGSGTWDVGSGMSLAEAQSTQRLA